MAVHGTWFYGEAEVMRLTRTVFSGWLRLVERAMRGS